jgi:hypothetical protein
MINFQVFGLAHLVQMLVHEQRTLAERRRTLENLPQGSLPAPVSRMVVEQNETSRLTGLIQFALHTCRSLEIEAGVDRAERFINALRRPMLFIDLEPEIRVLREAIEDGLRYIGFYHYPNAKRQLLNRVEADWQATIAAFPSAKTDITEAVDCYAQEHYTASVYHLMRVLEHGLKELAEAVNLTLDVQQWHNIITDVETEVRGIADGWRRGTRKADWVEFYSSAAKEFFHFKDGWRNHVSHNRATYDEPSARNVLEHVRTFMNHLSSRLGETV